MTRRNQYLALMSCALIATGAAASRVDGALALVLWAVAAAEIVLMCLLLARHR
ncbi:hypothetical protein [Streptomyces chrestomyceticus]|uniref:hypothetical protein n=1 Tax=Streptomyces chrestomyceticus TaxID=68185 RepID=UPI0035A8C8A4